MHIGLGCALENLLLAAAANGYSTQVALSPDASDATLVARIGLTPGSPSEPGSPQRAGQRSKCTRLLVLKCGAANVYRQPSSGSWLKKATEWVRGNQAVLAARPVWLFSSGSLGTEVKDTEPQPKEIAASIARDLR